MFIRSSINFTFTYEEINIEPLATSLEKQNKGGYIFFLEFYFFYLFVFFRTIVVLGAKLVHRELQCCTVISYHPKRLNDWNVGVGNGASVHVWRKLCRNKARQQQRLPRTDQLCCNSERFSSLQQRMHTCSLCLQPQYILSKLCRPQLRRLGSPMHSQRFKYAFTLFTASTSMDFFCHISILLDDLYQTNNFFFLKK